MKFGTIAQKSHFPKLRYECGQLFANIKYEPHNRTSQFYIRIEFVACNFLKYNIIKLMR